MRLIDAAEVARLGLTRRESEVLAWVAVGKRNAEVATILGMRPRTVGKHLERMKSGGGHGFGPALARARERRRLTRRELARRLDVSHMTVRRWESGVSLPNARHYAALVAVVGPLEHGSLVRFEEVSRRIAAALSEIGGTRPPSGCR